MFTNRHWASCRNHSASGKTPSGKEVRGHCAGSSAVSARTGRQPDHHSGRRPLWPQRGDGLVRGQTLDYVFGLPATRFSPPPSKTRPTYSHRRALEQMLVLRGYAQRTTPPNPGRLSVASAPASKHGTGAGYPLRRHQIAMARQKYLRTLYCARGQMENLIKLHKSQLAV